MDLQTTYLGLTLKHPLVASAGPIARSLDGIKQLEDGNAAAIVLPSLFEEQFQNGIKDDPLGPDDYMDLLRRAVEATDIPIIASLNGVTNRGWRTHAQAMEEAGAGALELNVFHIAADVETTGAEVEERYVDALRTVKQTVTIPVAMKLSPFFTAFGAMAKSLVDEGADGLVLFNRFYQPDIDLSTMSVLPTLELSNAHEARLPLMWIGVLSRKIEVSIAATTGIQHAEQAIKYLLAGADVAMTTSSLLRNGPRHMADLLRGLAQWMHERDYAHVDQIRGALSQDRAADPTAFVRANYVEALRSY
ncbi:MAG: dihydroorotate dehydrogenase-like protein [Geminicoccaceae bacterium]